MKFISSRENSVFKQLKALAEDTRMRRQAQATLIDGDHLLQAALDTHWPINRLLVREDLRESEFVQAIQQRLQGQNIETLVLSSGLFNALSPVVTPTGVMAEISIQAPRTQLSTEDDVLVLAGVQDAGNLGTLLRSAVAAGCRQVWLDQHCAQAWSPKALRAGMGAQFNISILESCDLKQMLSNDARQTLATSLGDESVSLYELDLRKPNVWMFGSEGQGLPPVLLDLAQRRVRIPMPGSIESLNVGAAAAVCLFEQVRQRMHG